MQTTKRKPKPKKVKDYISPKGKKIIAKVLNDFSKRKKRLEMGVIVHPCNTMCCFAGGILIEKLGVEKARLARGSNFDLRANRIIGLRNGSEAANLFASIYRADLHNFTHEEYMTYISGHRTRALRMAVSRTMETEV